MVGIPYFYTRNSAYNLPRYVNFSRQFFTLSPIRLMVWAERKTLISLRICGLTVPEGMLSWLSGSQWREYALGSTTWFKCGSAAPNWRFFLR